MTDFGCGESNFGPTGEGEGVQVSSHYPVHEERQRMVEGGRYETDLHTLPTCPCRDLHCHVIRTNACGGVGEMQP